MPIPINPKMTKYMELYKIIQDDFKNNSKIITKEEILLTATNIIKDIQKIYGKLDFFESVEIAKKLYIRKSSKYDISKKIIITI